MEQYIARKDDGVIFPFTKELAVRTDKFEVVTLKKLPKSGVLDMAAYHQHMQDMEEKQTLEAKEVVRKAVAKKAKKEKATTNEA